MAKRARVASSENKSRFRDEHSSIDRISILPDELLAFILSFLTLKEAAATSILSHRWRYLWIFIPKLDFDGTEFLVKVISKETESELALYDERWNYVGWVDDVIALHEGCTIEELRVFFNLTKTHKKHIDRWLRFALARKVERLELNLVNIGCRMSRKYDECYTFPYELLRNRSSSVSMRKCDSIDFRYLRRISMRYVNVNGEALEFFLCNCPFLEHLSVSQSGELSTLKIIGPFPSFKRLEICMCYNLNSVEIRDANLVYLKYKGKRIRHFLLENVPMLVEILVGGVLTYSMEDVLLMLSSCLPQLERFTMERLRMFSGKETRMFCSSVKMSNLKQLVVKSRGLCADSYVDSLIPLTNFILASPFLQRFVLEVSHWKPKFVKRIIASGIVRSYPHLKKVEFTGYRGGTNEQELVLHFLENAVALKEILIDPRERENCLSHVWNCYYNSFKGKIIEDEMNAIRARAREQLTKRVPPGVNLKIL